MEEIKHKKDKIYYSMGEVAEMFDVNPSLIRYWESKFDILKPHKNKKGNRMFTPEDVDNLKLIYHLVKEKGMTLAGAQKQIKDNKESIKRNMEIVDRLLSIRSMLLEIRQELKMGGSDEFALDEMVEDFPAAEDCIVEPLEEEMDNLMPEEVVVANAVHAIFEEHELEPQYIAELSEELAEEAETAAEVKEVLAALDPKNEEPPKPQVREQTLF